MVWLEIPNFFHNWTVMFNNKSALYLKVKTATDKLVCDLYVFNTVYKYCMHGS